VTLVSGWQVGRLGLFPFPWWPPTIFILLPGLIAAGITWQHCHSLLLGVPVLDSLSLGLILPGCSSPQAVRGVGSGGVNSASEVELGSTQAQTKDCMYVCIQFYSPYRARRAMTDYTRLIELLEFYI
jgi:hypothetical protein